MTQILCTTERGPTLCVVCRDGRTRLRTLPTALAAPVELGMMLVAALRPPRQSFLDGPSTVFWVAVTACTVVISASVMPNFSCSTCRRQFSVLGQNNCNELYVKFSPRQFEFAL